MMNKTKKVIMMTQLRLFVSRSLLRLASTAAQCPDPAPSGCKAPNHCRENVPSLIGHSQFPSCLSHCKSIHSVDGLTYVCK
jgi:hypothetical protein